MLTYDCWLGFLDAVDFFVWIVCVGVAVCLVCCGIWCLIWVFGFMFGWFCLSAFVGVYVADTHGCV